MEHFNRYTETAYSQTPQIKIEDYFGIVYRSKWIILGILVVALAVALIKNDVSLPYYEATAKIWIQEGSEQAMPFLDNLLMPGLGRTAQLQTYSGIIQTRTIVAKAIETLMQEGRYHPLPVHRGKSVEWIAARLRLQLAKTEQGDLNPEEWAKVVVKNLLENLLSVEPSQDADIITIKVKQRTPERAQDLTNKIAEVFQEFIKEDMREQMKETEKFTTDQRDAVKERLESAEEQLREFQVSNKTVNLEAEAAMIIKNAGDLGLQKMQLAQRFEGTRVRLESLKDKLNTMSQEVLSAKTQTNNPNVVQLEQNQHAYQIRLAELKDKYPKRDHPDIKRLEARLRETGSEIAREDRKTVARQTTTLNPIHQALEQQRIEALVEVSQIERQRQVLNQQIENYDKLMARWPKKQLELARLKRTLLLNQELFSTLEATNQKASIASAAELGSVNILEKPDIPDKPVSPRQALNLALGFSIGLAFGIALAFLREYFDNTYPTIEAAQRQLESLPEPSPSFLGMIPAIEGKNDIRIPLITHDAYQSGTAEAFRILRTKLQFLNSGVQQKTILITSAVPGEGKSTIASNLAVTLAQTGKNVILVDADMRCPAQHKTFRSATLGLKFWVESKYLTDLKRGSLSEDLRREFENNGISLSQKVLVSVKRRDSEWQIDDQDGSPGYSVRKDEDKLIIAPIPSADPKRPGLSELLIKMKERESCEASRTVIKKTEVDNLHLISSGMIPPNPAELLNSEMLKNLIALVKQQYDYVVLDSPPVHAVADPTILSRMVDMVIFVFDIAKTKRNTILSGIRNLPESAPQKIGALCNVTDPHHSRNGHGYNKYGYYGRNQDNYSDYYNSHGEKENADE